MIVAAVDYLHLFVKMGFKRIVGLRENSRNFSSCFNDNDDDCNYLCTMAIKSLF